MLHYLFEFKSNYRQYKFNRRLKSTMFLGLQSDTFLGVIPTELNRTYFPIQIHRLVLLVGYYAFTVNLSKAKCNKMLDVLSSQVVRRKVNSCQFWFQ